MRHKRCCRIIVAGIKGFLSSYFWCIRCTLQINCGRKLSAGAFKVDNPVTTIHTVIFLTGIYAYIIGCIVCIVIKHLKHCLIFKCTVISVVWTAPYSWENQSTITVIWAIMTAEIYFISCSFKSFGFIKINFSRIVNIKIVCSVCSLMWLNISCFILSISNQRRTVSTLILNSKICTWNIYMSIWPGIAVSVIIYSRHNESKAKIRPTIWSCCIYSGSDIKRMSTCAALWKGVKSLTFGNTVIIISIGNTLGTVIIAATINISDIINCLSYWCSLTLRRINKENLNSGISQRTAMVSGVQIKCNLCRTFRNISHTEISVTYSSIAGFTITTDHNFAAVSTGSATVCDSCKTLEIYCLTCSLGLKMLMYLGHPYPAGHDHQYCKKNRYWFFE